MKMLGMTIANLGTWTTLDYPLRDGDTMGTRYPETEEWLKREASKIGAVAWVKWNAHDFGSYPSFEIDHEEYEELKSLDDMGELTDDQDVQLQSIIDDLNDLEQRYYDKFGEDL